MIVEAIEDLCRARWGEPSRRATFAVVDRPIHILKWNANTNPEGVALYMTAGMSSWPMSGTDPNHRIELFCGLLPENDDIAPSLALAATYPVRGGSYLDHGHSIRLADPLWDSTAMQALLIMRPVLDILEPLVLPDGVHVAFLQAIPVYESELAYKARNSAEALMARWKQAQVPFWDPYREPEPATS